MGTDAVTVEKNGFKQLVKELNTRSHAENTSPFQFYYTMQAPEELQG